MIFFVLQKDGRELFPWIQLRLTLLQTPTLTYLFPSLTIQWMKKNKTLIVCSVLVISLKTTMQRSGYDVQNVSAGRTYFVLEKDFVCEPCQGSQ
jgi:predicted acyltransferase